MTLTARQLEVQAVLAGPQTHIMLYGGSRSGKTFLLIRAVIFRALKAAKSRHAVLRFRFNAVKASVVLDTFPKVMRLAFPGVEWTPHHQDGYATIAGNSQIWFAGLDDKERTEKILGMEFATLYFNESSQIPIGSVDTALTRLAQRAETQMEGVQPGLLRMRAYYDCNPPNNAHWTYKRFVQKVDPETKKPLTSPEEYASFQINPRDNQSNLSPEYLKNLGVEYHIETQDTYSIVKRNIPEGKTMCSLCSRLRRGILYNVARKLKCNKLALGHHRDDMLQTFFLNMFFGGKLKGMPPKLTSDNGEFVVIRPLAYVAEKDLIRWAAHRQFPIIPCSLCGSQTNLQRVQIGNMLRDWEKQYPGRAETMFTALQNVVPSHLMDHTQHDFKGIRPTGVEDENGDKAFDVEEFPTAAPPTHSGLPGVQVVTL